MFKKNYESMAAGTTVEDPNEDAKNAKRVGKYKISASAIYTPDNRYLPKAAIETVVQDKGSVHVTGCCIGCVPVDRLIVTVDSKPVVFDFDSEKQVKKAREILGI